MNRFAEKISAEEFARVFADNIPVWAIDITYKAPAGTTCAEVRAMISAEIDRRAGKGRKAMNYDEAKQVLRDCYPILRFFDFSHLARPDLREVSELFHDTAYSLATRKVKDEEERLVALRKLLEAKDAAVRAMV